MVFNGSFNFLGSYYKVKTSFNAAFKRVKAAENSPLRRRGGLLGHSEKTSMHLTLQKQSFGGHCKYQLSKNPP